jgi:hypothetical protein
MTNSQRLNAVRHLLQTWYLDRQPHAAWDPEESILVRGGFYCGRRFRFQDYQAVWFAEEDQVKIYDPQGRLVESMKASSPPACLRQAA